ncbi:hypothetical protein QBZ16_001486 [Prototheca wickerhamii]|uniref:Uncharacterized protein n=1 Tax=Prototheca wickerhamii TaxID=3111 RepID=A0AAD9IEU3_PROWI|nr:hypothetical protein QBZ16_001486 [Prototheca wickerhamii]
MEASEAGSWDAAIQVLLADGVIKGYTLLDQSGTAQCAYGEAQAHLVADTNSMEGSELAKQLQASVGQDLAPESLALAGSTLHVLRKEDDALYAMSESRTEGVMAYKLKIGFLIVLFGAPQVARQVVPKVEVAVEPMRSQGPIL